MDNGNVYACTDFFLKMSCVLDCPKLCWLNTGISVPFKVNTSYTTYVTKTYALKISMQSSIPLLSKVASQRTSAFVSSYIRSDPRCIYAMLSVQRTAYLSPLRLDYGRSAARKSDETDQQSHLSYPEHTRISQRKIRENSALWADHQSFWKVRKKGPKIGLGLGHRGAKERN